ncbi:MAG: ATP-binding protein [Pseudobdellovibrio sp.]
MKTYKQTHSISRRLLMTILVVSGFFMIEFVGMYYASQNTLTGLSNLHMSVRSITQVRQLRQILIEQQGFLSKAEKRPLTPDEIVIFKNTRQQAEDFFALNLNLAKEEPRSYQLIADAKKTLEPLNAPADAIIRGDKHIKIKSTMIDQYNLEAQDLLGKVQLVLKNEADQIFESTYNERYTPLIAGLILSSIFILFAFGMGISLKNKIDGPIRELIEAFNDLASGKSGVRAPIHEANEVGLLGHGFNIMAARLEETSQDLISAKEAAEAANLAKSAFLANMSHEIRTPLGAVLGFADLVMEPNVEPSEKANFVSAVKRNGELLSNIINDILDLSKIEAGSMKIVSREVPLFEVLTDTKTLLDLNANEKGISLNVTTDESVPETIQTDPLRLRQVLINIIGNAIKFTSKGSVDVRVTLQPVQNGKNQLAFIVKDTGTGIKTDQIGKLFTPFSQADTTSKRKFGGTGLGLVISKRFANLLGGDVVLTETTQDKGSTFTITIDPGTIRTTSVGSKPKTTEVHKKNLRLDGINVLLAEDSPDNQALVTRLLKLAGANVEIVSDGKAAVAKAGDMSHHYDVLLMDLQMPVMDGYEATAQLRKQGYNGKIVALTAHTLSDERERCLQSGFDEHIGKPINRDILIERVYSCATGEMTQ